MQVDIPYGKEFFKLDVPLPESSVQVVLPRDCCPPPENEIISNAIEHPEPEASPSFSEFMAAHRNIILLTTDGTRPTPTAKILDYMWPEIEKHPDVKFMIAKGTHRQPNQEELERIFGHHLEYVKARLLLHDADDESILVEVGTTSRGTVVKFNRAVVQADGIIAINNVKPHYFAGYTGGRKLFLPGVAAYSSIEHNHSFAVKEEAQPLALEGNPVAEDMDEAAAFIDPARIFSIQSVMTKDHKLYALHTGDLKRSFISATESAKELYTVPIERKANIVLTANPYPMDSSLYQSQHALENCKSAIEDGGIMIMVSKCWDGVGNDTFLDFFDSIKDPSDLEEAIQNYELGYHKSLRMLGLGARIGLWAVTDLDDSPIVRAKMKPYNDASLAVRDAIAEMRAAGKEPSVMVIPHGGMTVPYLE